VIRTAVAEMLRAKRPSSLVTRPYSGQPAITGNLFEDCQPGILWHR
jgi:hypothetical protein